MLTVALQPHPISPAPALSALRMTVQWARDERLHLEYRLDGALGGIRIDAFSQPQRGERLWEHTCFELFLRDACSASYCELNFATTGAWAAYRFADYRTGMQPIVPLSPQVSTCRQADTFVLRASISLAELDPSYPRADLRLAPSAVLEDSEGERTYWAAHHAAAKPDFHHKDAFTIVSRAP
jgi:hypothetical protein